MAQHSSFVFKRATNGKRISQKWIGQKEESGLQVHSQPVIP